MYEILRDNKNFILEKIKNAKLKFCVHDKMGRADSEDD